jgi:phenylpropionate dioxygenase-like ring-hydroxylating dioxygenase large terminal subunit
MGEVMRRYWHPILMSQELPENDGAPIRVKLLGEELVAFRDSEGKVGLLDAYCPHRRAPLFFGRNEECGIRCVYHGWKFDTTGKCVDMPSEPPDSLFRTKVNITAYSTYEGGGVVWAYMGPPAEKPTPPNFEWMRAPETHRFVSKTFEDCNWLQALEGGIDSAHGSFLHNEWLGDDANIVRNRDKHPRLDVEKTDFGFSYTSTRDLGDDGLYVRVYHFVMPYVQLRGTVTALEGKSRAKVPKFDGHIWVPIDDHTCYAYNMLWSFDPNIPITTEYRKWWEHFLGRDEEDFLPGPGFKLKANRTNDYFIDRERQKHQTYTGITGINTQDYALQENMGGGIVDRSKEHLGTTDKAIIVARQLLLEACDVVAGGAAPRGNQAATYENIRPYDDFVPPGQSWQEAWKDELIAKW